MWTDKKDDWFYGETGTTQYNQWHVCLSTSNTTEVPKEYLQWLSREYTCPENGRLDLSTAGCTNRWHFIFAVKSGNRSQLALEQRQATARGANESIDARTRQIGAAQYIPCMKGEVISLSLVHNANFDDSTTNDFAPLRWCDLIGGCLFCNYTTNAY